MYQLNQENAMKSKLQKQQERVANAKVEEFRRKKQMAAKADIAR